MAQERFTLRKIREILRLKEEAGLANRAVARACNISNSTVGEYLRRAEATGLHWPLPEELSEEALYQRLFPESEQEKAPKRELPDWEKIRQELKHKGVTLKLLWIEYHEKRPDGYRYTQFCEYYRKWLKVQSPSGRFSHRAGEELEVDYAGLTMTIVDPETSETRQGGGVRRSEIRPVGTGIIPGELGWDDPGISIVGTGNLTLIGFFVMLPWPLAGWLKSG